MILEDDLNPITERTFRQDEVHREKLRAFLATETGQQLVWLFRKKTEIKGAPVMDHAAIPTLSIAELSRLRGCQEMLTLLLGLRLPPEGVQAQQAAPPSLGNWNESDLPPAIHVPNPKATR